MTNGFAGLIGRWYQRHIAEHTPVQKGAIRGANSEPALSPPVCGAAVSAPQSSEQPEIFEGMVGFMNLCKIARAADNLEAIMRESVEGDLLELKADESGSAFLLGALCELCDALKPYRNARYLHRGK